MHYIFLILKFILLPVTAWCFLLNFYFLILSLSGFGKAKKDYDLIDDKTKFLILVAAHNEEVVIESTIRNLQKIDYNSDLFDIVIVNDNSTDNTGKICDNLNMKHIDTIKKLYPREGVGKPAGIQYALRELGFDNLPKKYDLLMILDADNHVDSHILKELNSQYQGKNKPHAIQTYLDSKNKTSCLSLGYATSYTYTNRFFQLAKYRLGLPNAIGGTGFVVRLDYLIGSGGFSYKSLTEDLELEIEIVKSGGRILWNHFARIYDEKPDNLKMSLKQRTRWSQGHWYVAFTNFLPLLKKMCTDKFRFKYIDQFIYLFGMGKIIQLTVCLIGSAIALGLKLLGSNPDQFSYFSDLIVNSILGFSIFSLITFVYSVFLLVPYAIHMDEKNKKNLFLTIFSIYYYGITFIFSQFMGLLKCKQQHTWVKTQHTHTKTSDNI